MRHKKLNTARVISLLAAITVLLSAFGVLPVSAAEGGTCGEGLSWSFSVGTLVITGNGDMDKFSEPEMAPWHHLREEITRVVLPDGLTSIGTLAFYGCVNLKSVMIPNTVRSLGAYSFAGCKNLQMLYLGKSLSAIGNAAFYGCVSLDAVRLPYGLESLGYQAFYRCESLTAITVPANLSKMGTSVFAYCKNLIKAEILACLTALPEWTFYGCERLSTVVLAETVGTVDNYAFKNCTDLSTVYFSGDKNKADSIRDGIEEDFPEFEKYGIISGGTPPDSVVSGKYTENPDGMVASENTILRQEENMTLVTVVTQTRPEGESGGDSSYTADLSVTVENKDGWDSAREAVQDSLKEVNDIYSGSSDAERVDLTLYLKGNATLNEEFVTDLAGRQLTLTVISPDGSSWKVDCSSLEEENLTGNYNYSYLVESVTSEHCEKLGTDHCYKLTFTSAAEINTEVLIQLPVSAKYQNAYLYQIERNGEYTRLQAVAVDADGIGHFYLASVNAETEYLIGINVPGESDEDVIIPDTLNSQYGDAIARLEKINYVATGVKSSWGLTFWQVTLILLGVLLVCVVGVGVVMGVANKRKQKSALRRN